MIRETELGRYAARIGAYALLVHDQISLGPSNGLRLRMAQDVIGLWNACLEAWPEQPDTMLHVWSCGEDARDVEYVRDGLSVVAVVMERAPHGGHPGYVAGLANQLGLALS